MTIRADLAADTGSTVTALNEKVREVLTLGKPGETADYAAALNSACGGFDYLDQPDAD